MAPSGPESLAYSQFGGRREDLGISGRRTIRQSELQSLQESREFPELI
jgi:hypothetical protein